MNDWALYLGVAALLCAACSLLGAGLAHLWGVDPTRETPGMREKGAARRLPLRSLLGFLSMLPAALWLSAVAGDAWGKQTGAALCAGYALLCALLSFCAIFTAVRHGARGMASICAEELFPAAGKPRHALSLLAAVFSAGALLMSLVRDGWVDVSNGHLFLFSLSLWPMLSMQLAASRLAPLVRGEARMLSVSASGPVCAALIAILSLLPGASLVLSDAMPLALMAGIWLCWAAAWLTLCCLGGVALLGLTERPLAHRKCSALGHTLLCMAASVLLALYAQAWLFLAASVLCAVCVVMDAIACAVWLRRIGRGLFSRY